MNLKTSNVFYLAIAVTLLAHSAFAESQNAKNPTWWDKYQYLKNNAPLGEGGPTSSMSFSGNIDISNECGPQSETYITINPQNTKQLAAGSNEIFRLPMRGYYSSKNGGDWGGVDLPLPPTQGTNSINFGSDPTLAFDTQGNLFYGYIVIAFGNGAGVTSTQMAVARSMDGGRTYPAVTFFGLEGGSNHFNDKPMITADTNVGSPNRHNVYMAWDAAAGGSASGGGVRVATSYDQGASFTITRADDPSGPGRSIGACPAAGPDGTLYVAWNDYSANTIAFNNSNDAGKTWGKQSVIASKTLAFDIAVPAESFRGALVYPVLDVDRSNSLHRGRLYCSWMDKTANGTSAIFFAYSDNKGVSWSAPAPIGDHFATAIDRFNHWMSVDPVTGDVNLSFYDTRNDVSGLRYMTDIYLAQSKSGGSTWLADVRVSSQSSNEHDCSGVYPCSGINYGNQQGDYEGLVSFGGYSYPVWTDSRRQMDSITGCSRALAMEEVFTAKVQSK
jgi:hypothetical protein